jgi:hypothetical protein
MAAAATTTAAVGVFRRDEAYSFEALRGMGFGAAALREMQRDGLKARRAGRLKVVLGSDLIDYLENLPIEQLTRSSS